MSLFDLFDQPSTFLSPAQVKPPPRLKSAGVKEVFLDFETTGLRWWEKDRPGGVGVCTADGLEQYIAWGHWGGGNNITEENARQWMKDELEGLLITNLNTKFEVHMAREFGVDFEAMGCRVADVGHYAALLDDHRKRFSLESLVDDMLVDERKVKEVNGQPLDGRRMMSYHADLVAVRAIADVRQVMKLKKLMWPKLTAEDLHRVRQLEEDVIYPVCEMEKNGTIIDHERVDMMVKACKAKYDALVWELCKAAGFKVNPNSAKDKLRLWQKLKLPLSFTEEGSPSFTGEVLKQHQHPIAVALYQATKYRSVLSKLETYQTAVDSKGIMRYGLHQLRAVKDGSEDGNESGTVSGRFSSTEITDGVGINCQQVWKLAKQRVAFGFHEDDASHDEEIFPIRSVHIPLSGLFLSADAMQVEYRIFASMTKSKRLIDAYADDFEKLKRGEEPLSFHRFMHATLKEFSPDLTYRRTKDLNFAKIYSAGLKKLALMLGFITKEQFVQLTRENATWRHPLLAKVVEVNAIYNREVPEVKPLLEMAAHIAKGYCDERCRLDDVPHRRGIPHRGFVRTIEGRRSRFPGNKRLHKALNAIIQGTAADIMKRKLVELHAERRYTSFLMRMTVHDEVDGDIPDKVCAERVREVLNRQSYQLSVPILWDVTTGRNWAEAS